MSWSCEAVGEETEATECPGLKIRALPRAALALWSVKACQTLEACSPPNLGNLSRAVHVHGLVQLNTCSEKARTYTAMSAEEGSGQPPTAGADKTQPAKPAAAAFTSSFINSALRRAHPRTMLNGT